MSGKLHPPFRAEHVGSLLRPEELKRARARCDDGEIDARALARVEDRLIIDAVRLQEELGFQGITDGEFRRYYYFDHFPAAVSGFTQMEAALDFQDEAGRRMKYTTPVVTGKIRRQRGIATAEYRYVASLTRGTPKVTLPSPSSQHYFRFREGLSNAAYPDLEEFFADVARVYREELAELGALGARYVQLDDVSYPLLCDPKHREVVKARGHDPDWLLDRYTAFTNEALRDRPKNLAVGLHLCRGNNQGKWLGEGGYDFVAEHMFGSLDVDFYCLEYDSPRAGSFAPLRFVPADRVVVLGLISTKTPALESADAIRRRIDEAARVVPLERLCLSPQCGFASVAAGNPVTAEVQRRKLALVVEIATAVWH
jgi:5-methyltetrahydropteroyltriglutamate--homocysteine methyltransferase